MDDVAGVVVAVGVEHPQQPAVVHRGGEPRGLGHPLGQRVGGVEAVERDVALEHPVVRSPEASRPALGEQVDQQVAVGEHVARPG